MNNHEREKEEYLERLWCLKDKNEDSLDILKNIIGDNYCADIIDELLSENLVELSENNSKIFLTEEGRIYARRIIRAHRIGERLIYDVFGGEFESGACEFEHIVTTEIVDSICILLGHPKECPHGMPIPDGECCKRSAKTAEKSVIPLTELIVGGTARIAYVSCKDDPQLHRINGLQLRPGIPVKLHQTYPSYVIECEGANIAMDKEVVSHIYVWKNPQGNIPV